MKSLILLLLLALIFIVSGHTQVSYSSVSYSSHKHHRSHKRRTYRDLRATYYKKAQHHKKLYISFRAHYKRFVALSRQYHSQARSYRLISIRHRSSARSYLFSARRHSSAAFRLNKKMKFATRRSRSHFSRSKHFTSLAIRYERLARQARSKSAHHLSRHRYYASLYGRLKVSWSREVSARRSDLRNRSIQRKYARDFFYKSKRSRKIARGYARNARFALKKHRINKRLHRRYVLLHRRAVYLHNARLHRISYRRYMVLRRTYYRRASYNRRLSIKFHGLGRHHTSKAKRHDRVVFKLRGRVSYYLRRISQLRLKIRRLNSLILIHQGKASVHRRKSIVAHASGRRHKSLEISFVKLARKESLNAAREKRQWKRWIVLWRSTFKVVIKRGFHKRRFHKRRFHKRR